MMTTAQAKDSRRWLPGLNFFLADVRDGLGPFLGVFLMGLGWPADDIGYLMAAAGFAGMLATTPMGAWVDASRRKRALLAGGTIALIAGNLALWAAPSATVVAATQIVTAIVGALFGPALMGLTLGIVGPKDLPRQLGLNEAWNHAGNVAAAALAGLASYRWGLSSIFVLMSLMACASLLCLRQVKPQHIDHDVARGLDTADAGAGARGPPAPSPWQVASRSRELRLLAVTMMLFHLGNAAMLPLFGQAVATRGQADPGAFTALTIVIAQLVMIPAALLAGRYATRHGYWPLLTTALLALPLRGLIAGCWATPWALLPVQFLDGVAAGLLGVALPGLVATTLRGSGHVNAGLGAVMTIQGIGAAASPALAGWIAQRHGYGAAFLALSLVALLALLLLLVARKGQGVINVPRARLSGD